MSKWYASCVILRLEKGCRNKLPAPASYDDKSVTKNTMLRDGRVVRPTEILASMDTKTASVRRGGGTAKKYGEP